MVINHLLNGMILQVWDNNVGEASQSLTLHSGFH